MANSRMLQNAPLVEVIAEVHWTLSESGLVPRQSFEPSWFDLERELRGPFTALLPHVETLHQAGFSVPLEMLGRTPIIRYRASPGGWPLAQLGQGLLTVNATPPYDGWERVGELLRMLLVAGIDGSPAFRAIRLEKLQLQYRDAFTAHHGVEDTKSFFLDNVRSFSREPLSTLDKLVVPESIEASGELTFVIKEPRNAQATIRFTHGQRTDSQEPVPAAVIDFIIVSREMASTLDIGSVMNWFNMAHDATWAMFQGVVPDATRKRLE